MNVVSKMLLYYIMGRMGVQYSCIAYYIGTQMDQCHSTRVLLGYSLHITMHVPIQPYDHHIQVPQKGLSSRIPAELVVRLYQLEQSTHCSINHTGCQFRSSCRGADSKSKLKQASSVSICEAMMGNGSGG